MRHQLTRPTFQWRVGVAAQTHFVDEQKRSLVFKLMEHSGQGLDGAFQGQADFDLAVRLGAVLLGGNRHALGQRAARAGIGLAADQVSDALHQVSGHGAGIITRQQAGAAGRIVARLIQLLLQGIALQQKAGVALLLLAQLLGLLVHFPQRSGKPAVDQQPVAKGKKQREDQQRGAAPLTDCQWSAHQRPPDANERAGKSGLCRSADRAESPLETGRFPGCGSP